MGTIRGPAPVYYCHICTLWPAVLRSIVFTTNSQLSTQMVKLSCPEFVLIISIYKLSNISSELIPLNPSIPTT